MHAVHVEEGSLDEDALQALAVQLQALANWLGLQQVQLNCQRPVAQRLRAVGLHP
ncbi:hypothetical protein D3C78_1974830 [compost metagenome]